MATPVERRASVPSAAPTTPVPAPAARRRRAAGLRRYQQRQGWLYAAPTALFVVVFFVVPLLLVLQMSVSDWPLLAGNQGLELPGQLHRRRRPTGFFWPTRSVHPEVHGAHDGLLIGARRSAWPCSCRSRPAGRACCARRSWCRARSAWPRRRCSSTCSTRRIAGPFAQLLMALGIGDGTSPSSAPRTPRCGRRCSSSCGATPASTCCSCSSACRASPATCTRRPGSTAPAAGRPSATSRCRC